MNKLLENLVVLDAKSAPGPWTDDNDGDIVDKNGNLVVVFFDSADNAASHIMGMRNALPELIAELKELTEARNDLAESYGRTTRERNAALAELEQLKAERDWHSVDDADNLARCLCFLGSSPERYSVNGQHWPTSTFQRAVLHVLAGLPDFRQRIDADLARKDAEIKARKDLTDALTAQVAGFAGLLMASAPTMASDEYLGVLTQNVQAARARLAEVKNA